ncbi:S8 family peptidase [Bosea massiliensis]|uniref:S8 family peptidase n=1 Tax=Bosea massiliensis TaxID=151419 RepID=A0ABW0P0X0_9HYPH
MATERPILTLTYSSETKRVKGTPDRRRRPSETPQAQAARFGERFQKISANLQSAQGNINIRRDADAIIPDRALVLELKYRQSDFLKEAERLGFEWLLEEEDPDFAQDDLDDEDDADGVADSPPLVVKEERRLYAIMPSAESLKLMLDLWSQYKNNSKAEYGYGAWWKIFGALNDIRPWGSADRIDEWTRRVLDQQLENDPTAEVRVEFNLWFRAEHATRVARESQFKLKVSEAGGQVLDIGMIAAIQYHAALVQLPAARVRELIELTGPLASADEIMMIRPQSFSQAVAPEKEPASGPSREPPSAPDPRDPIVALLDGFPVENHDLLRNRVDVFPIDVQPGEASPQRRFHGTQMASLILHGDLDLEDLPLDRRLMVVPVLASPMSSGLEHTPPNKLPVLMIERAVRALMEGLDDNGPIGSSVVVINHSIGDLNAPFEHSSTHWSRLLDYLAHEYNLLFIVSAGNIEDGVPVDGFASITEFRRASPAERAKAILKGLETAKDRRPLISPAQTFNGITVGAIHCDAAGAAAFTAAIDPFGPLRMTNLGSRLGFGVDGAVKPDIVLPGGRQAARPSVGPPFAVFAHEVESAGQRSAVPDTRGGRRNLTHRSTGTSNAAALATRNAVLIADALDDLASGPGATPWSDRETRAVVLKCLLAHGCAWGDVGDHLSGCFEPEESRYAERRYREMSRFLGYGEPDIGRVVSGTTHRATMLAEGVIRNGKRHEFEIPLPDALGGKVDVRSVTFTLAWSSPVRLAAKSSRAIRLQLTDELGRSNFWSGIARKGIIQPPHRLSGRGTLFHAKLSGKRAIPYAPDSSFRIGVQALAATSAFNQMKVPYALAVSFEVAPTIEADIYANIRQQIQNRLRVQPTPVRTR